MQNAFQGIAQRTVNAENSFVQSVMEQFGKTENEAQQVLTVFKQCKAVKIDAVTGQFALTHGAFWDIEVINNALSA